MEINPNKQAGFLMEFRNLVNPLCWGLLWIDFWFKFIKRVEWEFLLR
jgi:hypothetical protein